MGSITMTRRVLVTGKNGQLGQSLQKIAGQYPQFSFEFVGREQLDLASAESVQSFFSGSQPYAGIINAAAYTAVDKAESEPEQADRVNHLAVAQLSEIARAQGAFLLHVSTDYVFDGKGCRPWLESDPVAPVNEYGRSKLAGEQAMQASGCCGAIVRTSWVYSEFGSNFVKTMLRLGTERDELGVIFDQAGTPTYATDLARVLLGLLEQGCGEQVQAGSVVSAGSNRLDPATSLRSAQDDKQYKAEAVAVYHFSNEGVCSWYDFACAIFELSGVPCRVKPIATSDYPTPAVRPHYSVLNKGKIRQQLAVAIPHWRDALRQCLAAM